MTPETVKDKVNTDYVQVSQCQPSIHSSKWYVSTCDENVCQELIMKTMKGRTSTYIRRQMIMKDIFTQRYKINNRTLNIFYVKYFSYMLWCSISWQSWGLDSNRTHKPYALLEIG